MVEQASRGWVLASDLTTPLAHQFIKSPVTQLAWGGLFRPEVYNSMPGIFMSAPYRPGKMSRSLHSRAVVRT